MPRKKPEKPYKTFPLFPHANGQWAKKIKGDLRYFGSWSDWKSALEKYLEQKDELQAGREPKDPGITLRELCELFLVAKRGLVDNGELSVRTWQTYQAAVKTLLDFLGRETAARSLTPNEFESLRSHLSKKRKAVALGNEIQRVRTIFKYGYEAGHLDSPMRFGPHFRRPARRVIRAAKHAAGMRMFSVQEIRQIFYSPLTRPQLRAMMLLGLNCGFGQSDIANLPMSAVQEEWIQFPRQKTAVQRRCPLWPETVEALRIVLENRPTPRREEFSQLVFLTRIGQPWVRTNANGTPDDNLGKEFAKLLKAIGIKRPKISFYALRHTFETIGQEAKDPLAVQWIMGHAPQDMGGHYRETVSDERLMAVVNTVRDWLWPVPSDGPPA